MNHASVLLLQVLLVLAGAVLIIGLLVEPTLEGVNANATSLYDIYFDDPFLAYIYFAFVPFFIAIYHGIKFLGFVGTNLAYSQNSVNALRAIRYCVLTTAGLFVGAVAYIVVTQTGKDDIAGGVAMGLCIIFVNVAIATAALLLERSFGRA